MNYTLSNHAEFGVKLKRITYTLKIWNWIRYFLPLQVTTPYQKVFSDDFCNFDNKIEKFQCNEAILNVKEVL